MNSPRYRVIVAYATTNFVRFGKSEDPVLMTQDSLFTALLMADPVKAYGWINDLKNLRRGMAYKIEMIQGAYEYDKCYKVFTIKRN